LKVNIDDRDLYELLKFKDKSSWKGLEYNEYECLRNKIVKDVINNISLKDFMLPFRSSKELNVKRVSEPLKENIISHLLGFYNLDPDNSPTREQTRKLVENICHAIEKELL